jgi:hypothetical protein
MSLFQLYWYREIIFRFGLFFFVQFLLPSCQESLIPWWGKMNNFEILLLSYVPAISYLLILKVSWLNLCQDVPVLKLTPVPLGEVLRVHLSDF